MIKVHPHSWPTAPVLLAALVAGSAHSETWAITDAAHPLTAVPPGVRIIKLDEQQRIESELSRNLPPNPHQAALAARHMMSTQAGAALMQRLASAQQDATDAWSAGVSKIPAVVVDRKFVVYGQPNVAAAIESIQAVRR